MTLLLSTLAGKASIVGYEYWFDSDYSSTTYVAVTPSDDFQLQEDFDTSSLSSGIHWLFIRFEDDQGLWSPAMSRMFHIPTPVVASPLTEAEYWFDGGIQNAQTIPLSGNTETLDVDLPATGVEGFHEFNIRFRTSSGILNPPLLKTFYETAAAPSNNVEGYRYWFNDDFSTVIDSTVGVPSDPHDLETDLATGGLPQGLNQNIKIQFQNTAGYWSAPYSGDFHMILGCWGDLTGDNYVDTADLLTFLTAMGCMMNCTIGDLNFDDQVNTADVLLFLSLFGGGC